MDVRRGDIGIVDNGTRNQKTGEPLLLANICRCPDGALAARALRYAESWLRATPGKEDKGRDTYSRPLPILTAPDERS